MLNKLQSFFRKIRHKIILKNIHLSEGISVLDTSCQDGSFLEILLKKNPKAHVYGVDINKEDIEKAKNNIPSGIFKLADNKNLPFADGSFDMVITSMTLHHMDDPVNSLLEMKRVLKGDGNIYLIDLIFKNNFLHKILKYRKCPEPYHFEKWYSVSDMQNLIQKCGLHIAKEDMAIIFPAISIVMPVLVLKLSK